MDGYRFDSTRECERYLELTLLQKGGEITDLELQPKYMIIVNDQKICVYFADFRYIDKCGTLHVEDVKGVKTALFSLKRKLLKAVHGIELEIVH